MARTPAESKLYIDQVAAEQFRNFRLRDLPVVYQLLMPVTSDIKELVAAEERIRALWKSELNAYLHTPWWDVGPRPVSVVPIPNEEWREMVARGIQPGQLPGSSPAIEVGLLKPIKKGYGVDPLDCEYKPFRDFHEVEQARKDYLESPLFKLREEMDQLWATVNDNGDFPNAESHERFMQVQGEISSLERSTGK